MNDSLIRDPLLAEVEKRFRLVPNFFVSTPDASEVTEKLWDFARAAYLDNPMPTLFKERLFVFLSRFCRCATASLAIAGFLSVMVIRQATPMPNCRPSTRLSSS